MDKGAPSRRCGWQMANNLKSVGSKNRLLAQHYVTPSIAFLPPWYSHSQKRSLLLYERFVSCAHSRGYSQQGRGHLYYFKGSHSDSLTFVLFPRQFIASKYPVIKKHNPDLPVLIREANGTPARVFARFGACTKAVASYSPYVLN